MAHDMHRHVGKVHEAALAAMQHAHSSVRLNSIKLASTLLIQSDGRINAVRSAPLMQSLHSTLVRAVDECDAATADRVFVALTEVVPFSWGTEACSRTQHLLDLALNATVDDRMPLDVCEHASLFIVELAQCQPHVLTDQHLFRSIVRRLTNEAWRAMLELAASSSNVDRLLSIVSSDESPSSDNPSASYVQEKREDMLELAEQSVRDGGPRVEVRSADAIIDTEKRCINLVRTLRLLVQSDGVDEAVRALARQLRVLSSETTSQGQMVHVLLLRTCCEASLNSPLRGLQSMNMVRLSFFRMLWVVPSGIAAVLRWR
jgi:hypothetical protein